jgi:TonB family protein
MLEEKNIFKKQYFYFAISLVCHLIVLPKLALNFNQLIKKPALVKPMTAGIYFQKPIKKRHQKENPKIDLNVDKFKGKKNIKEKKNVMVKTNKENLFPGVSVKAKKNQTVNKKQKDDKGVDATIVRNRPLLINKDIKVSYPKKAKRMMIEGVVRLRLTISKQGGVVEVKVLTGPAFGLRTAALKVAQQLLFLPATDKNGQTMAAQIDHEVIFRLNNGT